MSFEDFYREVRKIYSMQQVQVLLLSHIWVYVPPLAKESTTPRGTFTNNCETWTLEVWEQHKCHRTFL